MWKLSIGKIIIIAILAVGVTSTFLRNEVSKPFNPVGNDVGGEVILK